MIGFNLHLLLTDNQCIIDLSVITFAQIVLAACLETFHPQMRLLRIKELIHLLSDFHQASSVARMAAIALGYLTFNATGTRNILTAFRLDPYLCSLLHV